MGINTKIYLNQHAKTKETFDVILKIMGNEFKQSSFDNKKFNPDLPANDSNPWHIKAIKNNNNNIELNLDYFSFNFQDFAGNNYHTLYFFEGLSDEYNPNEKIMNPTCAPIWCCIGKRLVDFFGGKLLYSDASDEDNPDNWYVCNNPKFPAKTLEQSSNDRWFQYHNAIHNETIISTKEIHNMEKKMGYLDDKASIFNNYAEKYEHAIQLTKELTPSVEKQIKTKGRKI